MQFLDPIEMLFGSHELGFAGHRGRSTNLAVESVLGKFLVLAARLDYRCGCVVIEEGRMTVCID